MLLAFELLNKYKKDKNFIAKEITAVHKKSKLILKEEGSNDQVMGGQQSRPSQTYFDPSLTQEERHRQIAEKREKRKQE